MTQQSLWTRFKNSAKRGLHIWLDLLAFQVFVFGVVYLVWLVIQIGNSIFGY